MTDSLGRMRVTMQQMDRLLSALDDLRDTVLVKNPKLFATMAEGPLDDLSKLRTELNSLILQLKPSA